MQKPPRILAISDAIYRKLLRLYPRAHREEYGALMAQLFRDQYRDAYREGRVPGILRLWRRALPDLAKNSLLEQIETKQTMQYLDPRNPRNRPLILLLLGLALGFLSFAFTRSIDLLRLLVAASALAILAKALLELFRPSNEWKRFALGSALLLFIYGLFMPAWAKADHSVPDLFKMAIMGCLFANPIVAFIKLFQFLLRRRPG
jgi:hypothetical protein